MGGRLYYLSTFAHEIRVQSLLLPSMPYINYLGNPLFGTEELAKEFPKGKKYLHWPMLICFNIEK